MAQNYPIHPQNKLNTTMECNVTQQNQIMTDPKFKIIIKLRLSNKPPRVREKAIHTLWSPPPVANRSPPGWTSMEKICMPSCLTQLGFSAIIFQKCLFSLWLQQILHLFLFSPNGGVQGAENFTHWVQNLRDSNENSCFLNTLCPPKALWKPESAKPKWRVACKNQAIILVEGKKHK